jgi:ABC-type maltose transport system permease subunit
MDSLRSFWNDVPALRILIPFALGIISAIALLHFTNSPSDFIDSILLYHTASLAIAIIAFSAIVLWGYFQKDTLRYYRICDLFGEGVLYLLFFY